MIWGPLCVWINNHFWHFWAMSDGSEMKNNQPSSVLWLTALEAQEINFVDKLSLVLVFVEIWEISHPLVQKYFWCENVFCKDCDVCSGIVWSLSQQNVESWQRRYLRAWKRPDTIKMSKSRCENNLFEIMEFLKYSLSQLDFSHQWFTLASSIQPIQMSGVWNFAFRRFSNIKQLQHHTRPEHSDAPLEGPKP